MDEYEKAATVEGEADASLDQQAGRSASQEDCGPTREGDSRTQVSEGAQKGHHSTGFVPPLLGDSSAP